MPGFDKKIFVVIFSSSESRQRALEFYLSKVARERGYLIAKDIDELKTLTNNIPRTPSPPAQSGNIDQKEQKTSSWM
jgi:hypothetical protein